MALRKVPEKPAPPSMTVKAGEPSGRGASVAPLSVAPEALMVTSPATVIVSHETRPLIWM